MKMDKKKTKLWIVLGVFVILILVIAIMITGGGGKQNTVDRLLDLGNQYLEELDYEAAIAVFDKVLTIDPACEPAYYGKAEAYYALGDYNAAREVLVLGITMVEDAARLESRLEEISAEQDGYAEISEGQNAGNSSSGRDETGQNLADSETNQQEELVLNYVLITRHTATEQPEIQLKVINEADKDRSPEEFEWTSTNEQVAQVSENGLITCQSFQGYAEILVNDGERSAMCSVLVNDNEYEAESEVVFVPIEDYMTENPGVEFIPIRIEKTGEEESAQIYNPTQNYVYFSGDIKIPENLQYDGKTIEIEGIDIDTFLYTTNLESIDIPANITVIGEADTLNLNPFRYCNGLKSIEVDPENPAFSSRDGVLYSKDGKTLIAYPASKDGETFVIPEDVEYICSAAFAGCTNLKEIVVEESNTYYEAIDGVLIRKEDGHLLAYPVGREEKEYTVPEKVTSIGMEAFYNSSLERIECGGQVINIETGAFHNCSGLAYVGGLDNVEYIDDSLFNGSGGICGLGGGEGNRAISLYNYDGSDTSFDLTTLKDMVNLESLEIHNRVSEGVEVLKNMPSLARLTLKLKDISDLSWLKEIPSLTSIELFSDGNNENMDLKSLTQCSGLTYLRIGGYDSIEITEEMKEQLDLIKNNNPDCSIFVGLEQYG